MPNAALASSAQRQIQTDHSEIIGNAANATFQTSPADIPASSARNRILMEARTAVARASVAAAAAEEVDAGVEVVVVEEAVSEEAVEAVEIGVFQEEKIHRKVIRKSLLTSRAL